mmetsp:Transcript_12031/g.32991  ORF Transcript_12031/g.32991 Transcript_12031/m.32991 type:complete len:201 (+) Transcript_12031:1273-1875(+)
MLNTTPGTLNQSFPGLEGFLLQVLGELYLQQGQQVLAGCGQELAEFLLQRLNESPHQTQGLLHLLEHGGLQAQDLSVDHCEAHVRLVVIRVFVGHVARVDLRRSVLQGLEDDGEQCRNVRLEVLPQRLRDHASRVAHRLPLRVVGCKTGLHHLRHHLHDLMSVLCKGLLANSQPHCAYALKRLSTKRAILLTSGIHDDLL